MTTFSCMLHSTPLLFPLLAVKCWRMEAAGNSLAQSSSCKVGTFAAHNYVSGDIQCIHVYFRLPASLSNTTHVMLSGMFGEAMVHGLATAACCLGRARGFYLQCPGLVLTCWFSRYPCRYPSIHSRYLQLALISARYDIWC